MSSRLRNLLAKLKSSCRPTSSRKTLLQVESLEDRVVPTGTWTTVANLVPADRAQMMLLLSDGSVMVHGLAVTASSAWYRLTPNSSGNYANGTWSKLPSMNTGRLYFTSDVLPDGRVFVLGGEYSGTNSALNFTNSGEIYDPVANTWTSTTPFPRTQFGDDPSEVLPNGKVLAGYLSGSQTYLYDSATNSWSATGSKLRSDASDEETWVKLPDGSILSYDIFSSISSGVGHAQRYVPSLGTWVDAGTLPEVLSTRDTDEELGPAFLLPDGRAFFLGADGNTAFYTPPANLTDPGSWTAGPAIPNGLTTGDAPGAMLPNGHVLFAAAPPISPKPNTNPPQYIYPSPTTIFEFDPTTDTYTDVTPRNFSLNLPSYSTCMLVLPTGQVMLANDSGQIDIYTPDGDPNPSWQPVITNITDAGNGQFLLTGTQLNGISEGATYGDDAEMASNYPLVRLTDADGHISYARTFNWSSTGLDTGNTPESVEFTLPPGTVPGAYLVSVIANGISSAPVLDIQMGSVNTNLTLQVDPNNAGFAEVLNNGSILGEYAASSFSSVLVTGSNMDNSIAIQSTFSGVPVTVNEGSGNGSISVGDGTLDSIQSSLTINGTATDTLVVNDGGDQGSRSFTITESSIAWGTAALNYTGLGTVTITGGT
ncbi:MAG TPA: kelch repeat-containing protein, partial [Gemmataceae bacterium]|nr:kelch repeat-containing protein [Gemmataceae bacterium]